MILHPTQQEVILSPARYKVLVCGRGWGKTAVSVDVLGWNAINKDKARVLYISPTYQTSRDIAWARLRARFADIIVKTNETLLELTVHNVHGGFSQIVLRGWENVDTLRGQEFDFIVIDEVDSMRNFWEGWQEVLIPTLRMSQGGVYFIGTPKGFSTLYALTNQCGKFGFEDWKAFHYTSYDNPHLPVEEIETQKRQLPENTFAQEYLADFRKLDTLIFPEFDRKTHLFNDEDTYTPHEDVAGVDFAYAHACAILHITKDTRGDYWVTDELYKTKMTDLSIAEYVAAQGFDKVYADPAQPQGIAELERHGCNCYPVVKGPDSVEKGISRIRELLKRGRIHVHEKCVNTLAEFETYQRDPDTGKIVKDGDDAMDALRYAIMTMEAAQNPAFTSAQQQHMDITRNKLRKQSTR